MIGQVNELKEFQWPPENNMKFLEGIWNNKLLGYVQWLSTHIVHWSSRSTIFSLSALHTCLSLSAVVGKTVLQAIVNEFHPHWVPYSSVRQFFWASQECYSFSFWLLLIMLIYYKYIGFHCQNNDWFSRRWLIE